EELHGIEENLRVADDDRMLSEEGARAAEQELRERRSQRERAAVELDRFQRDLAVASEEQTLYAEEKEQLLARKYSAIEELRRLEQSERECQDEIRANEEKLAALRATFEEITEVASKARVDVETAAGNVNAIQREQENVSRVVVSLGARVTQLQREIESLLRKQHETETAVENARGQLDGSLRKLHELSEVRIAAEAAAADLEARVQELETRSISSRELWNTAKDALFDAERRRDRAGSAFDLLREQVALDLHAG